MPRDGGEIAARHRTRPGLARAEAFIIRERLPNQRQENGPRAAPRKTDAHQNARGGFDEREKIRRRERSRRVVRGLGRATKRHRGATQCSRNAPGFLPRASMTLNHESDSFEQRNAAAAECLQRMHRASRRAEMSERFERAIIECAAGMQYNFASPFFAARAGELDGHVANAIVRRGNQDYAGIEHATRENSVRMPSANRAHSRTRGGRGARDDRANVPAVRTQAARERASDASSADDRNRGRRCPAHPQ